MASFVLAPSQFLAPAATTLTRHALAVGAAGHRGGLAVRVPAGGLARRGGRHAVVAAASAAPGGSSDDGPAPFDGEAVAGAFRMEMQLFKLSQRALAFLGAAELRPVMDTANKSLRLLECLLANKPVDDAQYKEVERAGKALVNVAAQCAEGYVRADAVIDATQGLKLAGSIFFPGFSFPEHVLPRPLYVPFASDDVADMDGYLRELLQAFVVYFGYVGWEARVKYGFDMLG
ncbi:unnamed protein product [Urochloa humidicola]